ncbi:hypothetical protein ACH4RA_30640 [Streptomyces smyrnaeus]|nr:hypothetical protein [Streptomyces sp. RK75]
MPAKVQQSVLEPLEEPVVWTVPPTVPWIPLPVVPEAVRRKETPG